MPYFGDLMRSLRRWANSPDRLDPRHECTVCDWTGALGVRLTPDRFPIPHDLW